MYDFLRRKPGEYKLTVVRSGDVKSRTVWEILSFNGLKCGVMNVPVISWPPQAVNGFVVSGLPDPYITTYPPSLSTVVKELGWVTDPPLVGKTTEQIRENLLSTIRRRANVAQNLIKSENPDFFMIVFTETDRAEHFLLSRNDEFVKDIYKEADLAMGRLSEPFGPSITIVMSDHVCGPIKGTFLTNCWLEKKGYLVLERPLSGVTSFEDSPVDWKRTRAYSFGEQGKIHINLRGREPIGSVPTGDYESLLTEIESELHGMRNEDSDLKVRTWRARELYTGKYSSDGPDLVFQIQNGEYGVKSSLGHIKTVEPPNIWSADHSVDGIYAIKGPGLPHRNIDASILDVTPTILQE